MSIKQRMIDRSTFGALTDSEHQEMLADVQHVIRQMFDCTVCDIQADSRMYRGIVVGVRKAVGEAIWMVDVLDNIDLRKLTFRIVGGTFRKV
jgi:ribosomal protein L37AE/L43A